MLLRTSRPSGRAHRVRTACGSPPDHARSHQGVLVTKRTTMARALTATAVAGAMLLGGGELASATHVKKVSSTLSIHYRHEFYGDVSSVKRKCVRGRNVRLYKLQRDGDRRLVGRDRTGRSGNWRIPKDNPKGRYTAEIGPKFYQGYAHTIKCQGDRSPIIKVRPSDDE